MSSAGYLDPAEVLEQEISDDNGLDEIARIGGDVTERPRKPGSKAPGKKRTKTGCLTCRKRRVKCTEEKPACQNCIKARRPCEGYNQRVVFKDPMTHDAPPWSASQFTFPSSISSTRRKSHGDFAQYIAPKPIAPNPTEDPSRAEAETEALLITTVSLAAQDRRQSTASEESPEFSRSGRQDQSSFQTVFIGEPTTVERLQLLQENSDALYQSPKRSLQNSKSQTDPGLHSDRISSSNRNDFQKANFSVSTPRGSPPRLGSPQNVPCYLPEDDEISVFEEAFHMAEHDDTEDAELHVQAQYFRTNDLSAVVALQAHQDTQNLSLRSYTSFIDRPNMLATYTPSSQSSPLRDSMTARIFCHFINVSGPSMSMFERHPANPSVVFQGGPVLKSQQHIWTYTFPTLALRNPALLHAMLAVASLHIARLQNVPVTASLKHYAIALRRVAKCVSLPTRRKQPATLAAAMLLAFYECWTADHAKWSNHLLGVKQLISEIDFAGITKYIRVTKKEQRARSGYHSQSEDAFLSQDYKGTPHELDENLVGMLKGKKLHYDQFGRVLEDDSPDERGPREYTKRDLEIFESQSDLWWWYLKQEAYQSLLGGGRLFMSYDQWSHCPPRAPIGQIHAVYGTFDHLMLLLGRLADFTSRDSKRKRLAMKANGGHWRPSEGMRQQMAPGFGQPGRHHNTFSPVSKAPPPMPGFDGLIPDVAEPKLPMGFSPTREDRAPPPAQDDGTDLDALMLEAEEEWQEIRNAFTILEDHLGEDFQPLGLEFSAPIHTPFGTALQYRTYSIAGVWMNYYMGLIACHRAHPAMPPAAMMAAGIAATQTAFAANELGRIAAGIEPNCRTMSQVSPAIGAALIESSTCLFVSGVQYHDAAQRTWTISRLRDVSRLTGWQTALAVASGCETSWIKKAEMGKGPIYTRTTHEHGVVDIWANTRRLDRTLAEVADERRLVIKRSERVHYALGLLGVPEDFERLDLEGDNPDST